MNYELGTCYTIRICMICNLYTDIVICCILPSINQAYFINKKDKVQEFLTFNVALIAAVF